MVLSRWTRALFLSAALAAAAVNPALAEPPQHPELNPLFAAEWWLRGHATLTGWTGEAASSDGVDAIGAWPRSTGEGVIVAVLDSGIDPRTTALVGRLVPGHDFVTRGRGVVDPLGHGTGVATLVAGNPQLGDVIFGGTDNGGIFGVAPSARILPLRVATARGLVVTAAAARAVAYAARDPRVRVINMSWRVGSTAPLARALAAAAAKRTVLLVAAAGNDARDLADTRDLPRGFDDASELTVAGTDILDRLAWFSAYGEQVEVAAPGDQLLASIPGGALRVEGGTSLATAIVSGVAALLFASYPQASSTQVRQAIASTCTPLADLAGRVACGGIVNAPAALAALAAMLGEAP